VNPAPGTFSSDHIPLDHYPAHGYALLLCDYWYCDLQGRIHRATIRMPSDGLTIPRFFWRVAGAPIRTPLLPAGIIHDHYCYKAASLPPGPERDKLRRQGDRLFAEMVSQLGANKVEMLALYRSVRIGARSARDDEAIPDYQHEYDKFMQHYITEGEQGK
jgi:hypothetical protein